MKRPFDTIIDLYRDNLDQAVENDKHNHEFLHSFTIWIIGFSIGSLYLIMSNIMGIKDIIPYVFLKSLIVLLCISIIGGILHRIFLFFYQNEYNSNLFYVRGALSDIDIMQDNPIDVSNEADIKTLIDLLRDDFDQDESIVYKLYDEADDAGKEFLINALRKKYQKIGDWAVKDYKIAKDHVKDVMQKAFGMNEQEYAKATEVSASRIRTYRIWSFNMLYISYSSFVLSLILLAICY